MNDHDILFGNAGNRMRLPQMMRFPDTRACVSEIVSFFARASVDGDIATTADYDKRCSQHNVTQDQSVRASASRNYPEMPGLHVQMGTYDR